MKFLVSLTCHVNVKLVLKYPPYHCVLYEDNEVTGVQFSILIRQGP